MSTQQFSQAVQDYVKTIYALQQQQRPVGNSALRARLNLSAAAVTEMIQTLQKLNLVRYEPYHGVELTPAGERVALEVIRHHRLIELYLHEALDVPWDEVHAEAEQLEHALSPRLVERIAERLGEPRFDPHGAPIPSRDLLLPPQTRQSLLLAPVGKPLHVAEVDDASPELLRYLADLHLMPGQCITITERAPFDGPLLVQVGDRTHALGHQAAAAIRVTEQVAA
jgi:DtxR family Mn-dependent transcriptional regulator